MTVDRAPPTGDVAALIAVALESAAISGLCREGCLEVAVDRLCKAHPEIDSGSAWAFVYLIDETIRAQDKE